MRCKCGKANCDCGGKKMKMPKMDAGALLKQFQKTGTVPGSKPKDVQKARKTALAEAFSKE